MSPNSNSIASDNSGNEKNAPDNAKSKFRPLPEKVFAVRNSLLTDLFQSNPHIKTIHHVFVATLLSLFINTLVHDYLEKGEIDFGFRLIYIGFGKFHIALLGWLGFFATTCLCYFCFIIWAKVRINLFPKSNNIKIWDAIWLLPLPGYYVLAFRMAAIITTVFQLPPASAGFLLVEQVRMLMKVHAFIRTNVPKVLSHKAHSEEELVLPSFSKFLYFFFAPTLIYRDEYPRTPRIRKGFVLYRSLEIIGVILFYSYLLNRTLIRDYHHFGLRKFTWSQVIISIFENAAIGMLFKLSTFYLILHSVQNFFAELMRFGDRLFYKDWWTCTSFSEYFRTWNVVVADWLYCYIYKDVYEIIAPRNKTLSKVTVFLVSGVVHEWVLTYMFGFFFPALFVLFLFGGALLSFVSVPKGSLLNVLFWYGLSIGSGSLLSLYTLEFYARMNSPAASDADWRSYLWPRWLTCDCIGK